MNRWKSTAILCTACSNNADEARAINKRHLQLAKDKIIQHFSEQEALKQAADAQPKTTAEADKKAK